MSRPPIFAKMDRKQTLDEFLTLFNEGIDGIEAIFTRLSQDQLTTESRFESMLLAQERRISELEKEIRGNL